MLHVCRDLQEILLCVRALMCCETGSTRLGVASSGRFEGPQARPGFHANVELLSRSHPHGVHNKSYATAHGDAGCRAGQGGPSRAGVDFHGVDGTFQVMHANPIGVGFGTLSCNPLLGSVAAQKQVHLEETPNNYGRTTHSSQRPPQNHMV